MLMGIDMFEITMFIIIILALLLPLHIYFLFIKKGGLMIYSDKSSRQVMKLSMFVFVVFGFSVAFPTIVYEGVFSYASLWALLMLLLCAMITSFFNTCIFLILRKTPPNHNDGLVGGIIGALAFFLLGTLYYFSLYPESQYKTFTDFIFRSYLSFLILMPLFAGVVQGIIGGYYIGSTIKGFIGSLLMGIVVYIMFIYIFFTFGGH